MKEAYIPEVKSKIEWDNIPTIPIVELIHTEATSVKAFAQICYNEDAFQIRMTAIEAEIRKEESGPLCMPCLDSCLEFFFCPDKNDLRYFNFEFNPNGCMYLGFGSGPNDLIRLVPSDAQKQICFAPVVEESKFKWSISFQIPYFFVQQFFPQFRIQNVTSIRGNFYKCGDKLQHPHYLAWNRVSDGDSDFFHSPGEFGLLYLQ